MPYLINGATLLFSRLLFYIPNSSASYGVEIRIVPKLGLFKRDDESSEAFLRLVRSVRMTHALDEVVSCEMRRLPITFFVIVMCLISSLKFETAILSPSISSLLNACVSVIRSSLSAIGLVACSINLLLDPPACLAFAWLDFFLADLFSLVCWSFTTTGLAGNVMLNFLFSSSRLASRSCF